MKLRKLAHNMNLKGKRVLVRIDGNVPIVKGRAVDGPHGRIARAAVDIQWLSNRGARVIVMTHLGRPNGKRISAYSVKPIAKRLSGLLGAPVRVARSVIGKDVEKSVEKMADGDILLLENLRFDPRETENSKSFAKDLASLADIYVNDAFAVSHRAHTSLVAITKELPSYAGPVLAQEVLVLSRLEKKAKEPFVLVLGGLKMSTKLPIIKHFINRVDTILVGGALAHVFFVAKGIDVGKSVYEEEAVAEAKSLLKTYGDKIILPTDVVAVRSLRKDAKQEKLLVEDVKSHHRIVDLGVRTRAQFIDVISNSKTVIWNGPLGYCEIGAFCKGTREVARAISTQTAKATTIVGGGDTLPVVESLKLSEQFTLLSTGGGALLQFLAGEKLPGIEVLK
jgi:phosphoglycerate kinase